MHVQTQQRKLRNSTILPHFINAGPERARHFLSIRYQIFRRNVDDIIANPEVAW